MTKPKDVKRALILRCGALVDLVYAASVIDALRKEYGEEITIDFICTPGTGKLFTNDDRINHIFPLKHKKLPIWLSPQKRAIIRHSEQHPYDLLISLEFGKQFKSLINAIHATHKTGMGLLSTDVNTTPMNRGETTKLYYRDIISSEHLAQAKPILYGVPEETLHAKFDLPANAIVIAPSNSHNQKKGLNYRAWPFEHWRSLIATLSEQTPVLIVGGGEESFQPYQALSATLSTWSANFPSPNSSPLFSTQTDSSVPTRLQVISVLPLIPRHLF
jgi:ADP-heptose:LPS heptosyltransferase